MRSQTNNLVDENGVQLVDESGNELIASFLLVDYALFAKSSRLILHGYSPTGEYSTGIFTFNLVDENANQLVDEDGNELVAQIGVNFRLLHTQETKQIIHGG